MRKNNQRNLDWFNFWLQGKENPNSSKQEQYKRWRGMREKWEQAKLVARSEIGVSLVN